MSNLSYTTAILKLLGGFIYKEWHIHFYEFIVTFNVVEVPIIT